MSTEKIVKGLVEVDPGFQGLVQQMFGDVVDPAVVYKALYGPSSLEDFVALERIAKANPSGPDLAVPVSARSTVNPLPRAKAGKLFARKNKATTAPTTAGKPRMAKNPASGNAPKPTTRPRQSSTVMSKTESDIGWEGTFSKFDEDKRLAFGWSSIVKLDGEDVSDRQGDVIDWEELEKAAYDYILTSRKGGGMHRRTPDDQVVHVADIVESFVVTPEKIEKMGLPESTPLGWWVGMKVHDDSSWDRVKKGEWSGFSIHGRGKRRALA